MTVSELIDALKKLPEDTKVYVGKQDTDLNVRLCFPLIVHVKGGRVVSRPTKDTSDAHKALVL